MADLITSFLFQQALGEMMDRTGLKDRGAKLLTGLLGMGEAQASEDTSGAPAPGFVPAPAQVPFVSPSMPRQGPQVELMQAPPRAQITPPGGDFTGPVQNMPLSETQVLGLPSRDVMEVDLTRPMYNRPAESLPVTQQSMEADEEALQTASDLAQMGLRSPQQVGVAAAQDPGIFNKIKNYLTDDESMYRLAMAFNSLRSEPDQGLSQFLGQELGVIRQQKQVNRTADELLKNGVITPQQAELLRTGQVKASDLFGGTDKFSRILEMMKTPEGMKQLQQLKELGALGGGVNVQVGGQTMTPGREAVDKEYAKEYVQWTQSGGADMAGQLAQIQTVLDKLQSGEQLTGPTIGMAPDFYLYLTNPEAIDARQRVEEVVQRNLRVVLGAQFTEKEGERLISRAYDPKLPPEQNAARLRRLFQQMQSAVEQRNEMAAYFEQNGTLAGYKGKRPSFDDFYKAIEGGTRESLKPGDVVNGWIFVGGDPADKASWKKQGAE